MHRIALGVVSCCAVAAVAAIMIAPAACTPRVRGAGRTPAANGPPPYRFPHAATAHAGIGCVTCHAQAQVEAGLPARPGTDDHAPCDRSGCHADAFLEAPGKLCTLCHRLTLPGKQGGTLAADYPPTEGPRALAAEFSHSLHLDKARMDRSVGFHVACGDCHVRPDSADELTVPGHAACMRCHGTAAPSAGKRTPSPPLAECARCHVARKAELARGRRLIQGDLRFHHASHETDRAGKDVPCVTCHRDIGLSGRTGALALPETAACVACHDDPARAPRHVAMSNCAGCHSRALGGFAKVVAPRSHLPPRDRPDDHTLAFRKDHAVEAQREGSRCARCHTMMSGSSRDNCDECHQVLRPRDHGISWREFEHGPDAATQPERCATCHGGEYCVACHARPPRSHFPLIEFKDNHGAPGSFDQRACFTCHTPDEQTCQGMGCHDPNDIVP